MSAASIQGPPSSRPSYPGNSMMARTPSQSGYLPHGPSRGDTFAPGQSGLQHQSSINSGVPPHRPMYYKNMSSLGKQNSIVPTPSQGQSSMLGRRTHQQMQRSDSRQPTQLGLVNPQRPEKRQKKNNDGDSSEESLEPKRLRRNNDGDDSDEDADLFDNEGPDEPPTPAQKKQPAPQVKPQPMPQPQPQQKPQFAPAAPVHPSRMERPPIPNQQI